MIISLMNWIPVLNLIINKKVMSTLMFGIMYCSLLICPIIAILNIAIVLRTWYLEKTINIISIVILILNILFLLIGMKYLKSVAWIV